MSGRHLVHREVADFGRDPVLEPITPISHRRLRLAPILPPDFASFGGVVVLAVPGGDAEAGRLVAGLLAFERLLPLGEKLTFALLAPTTSCGFALRFDDRAISHHGSVRPPEADDDHELARVLPRGDSDAHGSPLPGRDEPVADVLDATAGVDDRAGRHLVSLRSLLQGLGADAEQTCGLGGVDQQ